MDVNMDNNKLRAFDFGIVKIENKTSYYKYEVALDFFGLLGNK